MVVVSGGKWGWGLGEGRGRRHNVNSNVNVPYYITCRDSKVSEMGNHKFNAISPKHFFPSQVSNEQSENAPPPHSILLQAN